MRDRPRIQRALLRRALKRQLIGSSIEQRALIRLAISDEAIFETVYERAMDDAKRFSDSTGLFSVEIAENGTPIVDNLLKLLQWFVDYGPELVKLIELISGLFGTEDLIDGELAE